MNIIRQVPTKKNGDENAPIIGFELTIDVMSLTEKVGKEIKVTYSATVNEHAIENVEKNSATLTYSNDPIKNITTDTKTDEEKVYSSKIEIIKHVTGNEDTMLNGAKFILYKEDENGNKLYYKYDTTNQVVTWINEKSKADVKITGEGNQEDGKAYFEGLKDGTYYLLETEAPDGYNLLPDAQTVQIINDGNNVTTITAPVKLVKVANSTGSVLPSTGGIGTTIFYAVGGVLVVGAGVLLITRKRMSVEK